MPKPPLVKDRPYVTQSDLTGRWWLVTVWREYGDHREAHTKFPFDQAVEQLRKYQNNEANSPHPSDPEPYIVDGVRRSRAWYSSHLPTKNWEHAPRAEW